MEKILHKLSERIYNLEQTVTNTRKDLISAFINHDDKLLSKSLDYDKIDAINAILNSNEDLSLLEGIRFVNKNYLGTCPDNCHLHENLKVKVVEEINALSINTPYSELIEFIDIEKLTEKLLENYYRIGNHIFQRNKD